MTGTAGCPLQEKKQVQNILFNNIVALFYMINYKLVPD